MASWEIRTDEEVALHAWRNHEWDAASRLCACGQFFEAVGRERNGHPEHRMKAALRAAESAGRDGDKQ